MSQFKNILFTPQPNHQSNNLQSIKHNESSFIIQEDKMNQVNINEDNEILSDYQYQYQYNNSKYEEYANRIKLMDFTKNRENHLTSNCKSEQLDDFFYQTNLMVNQNNQNRQLFFEQLEQKKEDKQNKNAIITKANTVMIRQLNNQVPQKKKECLNKLLQALYTKSDFQICISNFDSMTYQQLQKSPYLQINFQQLQASSRLNNCQINEIQNNQWLNIPIIEDEFIININKQNENNVSQEMKWQIINLKCLKQFQQIGRNSNITIEPEAERFQYKLTYGNSNQIDLKIYNKLRKFYLQLKDDLETIVILIYQCENDDESNQITNLLNNQVILKQLQQAFETNDVDIDYIQQNQAQKNECGFIYAIIYNYFEMPICQLQDSFTQIIQSQNFIKLYKHVEYISVDDQPDINSINAAIKQIQAPDIQIKLKDIVYNDEMKKFLIQININTQKLGYEVDEQERIQSVALEVKDYIFRDTTIKFHFHNKQIQIWNLFLKNQYKLQQFEYVEEEKQISIQLKGKKYQIEDIKQKIMSQISLLQHDIIRCKFEGNKLFFEFLFKHHQIIMYLDHFCHMKQKFSIQYLRLIGIDSSQINFEIIFPKQQDIIEIEEAIKSIIIDLSNQSVLNMNMLFDNDQQLIQQFEKDYQSLIQQNVTEYSNVKSTPIRNLISTIQTSLNLLQYKDVVQLQQKQWKYINKRCQLDIQNIQQQFQCQINCQDSSFGIDFASVIKKDKKILIRYGNIMNQCCDLFVNPIYKKIKRQRNKSVIDIEQDYGYVLQNLLGHDFESSSENFTNSNNFDDNVYQTKQQQIKFIINLIITEEKPYLDRIEKQIQDIFYFANMKKLKSITFPYLGLDFEIVQQTITQNIIIQLEKSQDVRLVVLLREKESQIKKAIQVLQKLAYSEVNIFMYKEKEGNWKNYDPEMNLKIHNLHHSDGKSNKFWIDYPITTYPATHVIDYVKMSIFDINNNQYSQIQENNNNDEKGYYLGFNKKANRELIEYIEFNRQTQNRKFEVCLKSQEFFIKDNKITSPKVEISCQKLNQDNHFMFQLLIKDSNKINEAISQHKNVMYQKDDKVKIEIVSKSQKNLERSKQALIQLPIRNYYKLQFSICKLSQELYSQAQNLILKQSIEYNGQVKQGEKILIIGFQHKLEALLKKLEDEGIQVKVIQMAQKDQQ